MYKICECGRICETKQSYCSHHGKCKVAHPEINFDYLKGKGKGRKMPSPWNKGLTKESSQKVKDISNKVSESCKNSQKVRNHCIEMVNLRNEESYRKVSETRIRKFSSGELKPPVGAGRGKYSYLVFENREYC